MISYYPITWQWKPLSIQDKALRSKIESKLNIIFSFWEGTPYMSGNQCLGKGVDCVRFVTAVLDLMAGIKPTNIKTLPSDASFHNKRGAMRAMIAIKRLYSHCKVMRKKEVQPGDIVIVGPPGGGPGHAMIVGTQPNTLWHCTPNNGVVKTGWSLANGQQKIFRVYRIKDRAKQWST